MLTALSDLGKVGTRVIRASKADTVANLKALQPTLTKLADAGANLPKALEMALTYPFPAAATGAVQGDYTNLRITADLDLRNIIKNLKPGGGTRAADAAAGLPLPTPADGSADAVCRPALPTVPADADAPVADRGIDDRCRRCPCRRSRARQAGCLRHEPRRPDDGGLEMIRRSTKLQLVAFALITLLGMSYVSARYVGLGDRLFGDGYVVTADFAESGGIFTNAEVTYRGVAVGRVDRLRLANDGVHVDLRLDGGSQIPADTRAVVENRSAVGEQYVDLQPRRAGGPYLADGSHITVSNTATPVHTETLLLNLNRLVESVDKRDLTVVIDELGAAFAGSGRDLQAIIDSGDALTKEAFDALPETIRLIHDGTTVLDTQRASGSAIKSFSTDLAALSATLRTSDGDLRKVLDNGIVASKELDALLRTNSADITALLANLLTTGQVMVARIDGLEQVLVTYPVNVAGGYTVVPGDGTSHFGLVLNANDPPTCTKGYGGTKIRPPSDTSSAPGQHRRPMHRAPRQPGDGARRTERTARAQRTGPHRARGLGGTAAARPGAPVSSSYVAGYDPTSGLAYGVGQAPLVFGPSGGQAQAFGKDSWQWLLLSPLSK